MQQMKRLVLVFLFGMLACGCAGPRVDAEEAEVALPPGTLNADQVTQRFSGYSAVSVLDKSGRVSLTYYNPDGTLRQKQDGEQRSGNWRVKRDGRICLDFPGERERCRIIVKEGETYVKYIVKKDNRHERILSYRSFEQGNLVD